MFLKKKKQNQNMQKLQREQRNLEKVRETGR